MKKGKPEQSYFCSQKSDRRGGMTKSWQTLTQLTGGSPMEIERVRLTETGVAIEGPFELPPLARLTAEDQVFVAAFVLCHGSIKQMEKYFGVSYPTIKNRLNKIGHSMLPQYSATSFLRDVTCRNKEVAL
jgi:hypothetical protein